MLSLKKVTHRRKRDPLLLRIFGNTDNILLTPEAGA